MLICFLKGFKIMTYQGFLVTYRKLKPTKDFFSKLGFMTIIPSSKNPILEVLPPPSCKTPPCTAQQSLPVILQSLKESCPTYIAYVRPFQFRILDIPGDKVIIQKTLIQFLDLLFENVHPKRVRVRTRGHNTGMGGTIRTTVIEYLRGHGVLITTSKSSKNLVLNVEYIQGTNGAGRLYIGLFPKRDLIKCCRIVCGR